MTELISSVSVSDWITVLAALTFLVLFLALIERFSRRFSGDNFYLRKIVHIITGLLIFAISVKIDNNLPLLIIAAFFIFFNWWAVKRHQLQSIHLNNRSWGTVYYAASIFLLALLLWNSYKMIFLAAILIMILPDALAGLAGRWFAHRHFTILSEKKSILGAIVMFVSSFLILYCFFSHSSGSGAAFSLTAALFTALPVTFAELLSHRGSDNLSVPLLSALLIYGFLQGEDAAFGLIAGILFSLMVSIVSYKIRFLDAGGAAGAFLLGLIIFGFGGWLFTIPILVFYITSSLLSATGKKRKKKYEASFEKTGLRDAMQVVANGGIPGLLVLIWYFFSLPVLYNLYLAALAVATADTWATEIGLLAGRRPRLITSLERVGHGRSGAVSQAGFTAAIAGSAVIALSGRFCNPEITNGLVMTAVVIVSGFLGNIIDSFLGASFQAQFRCSECGRLTEKRIHCKRRSDHESGYLFMNNDFVNILSIFSGCVIFIIFNIIFL